MADIELFFATPKPLGYLCTLGVGFVVSALWFFIRARKEKAPAAAMAALVLSLVLGGLFARLLYLLVEVGELPFVAEAFLHPEDVREFSFSGAILGVVLAAWLAEKGFGAKGLMNALAAPGLLMISIARLAECFVPFGTGQYLNGGFMQFFPLAMPDGYGEWMLSVWLAAGSAVGPGQPVVCGQTKECPFQGGHAAGDYPLSWGAGVPGKPACRIPQLWFY